MTDCSKRVEAGEAPGEACLARAARHVAHDLALFDLAWSERGTRIGYTLWFILARSLREFFLRQDRWKDNMRASDFLPDESWEDIAARLRETAKAIPEYEAVREITNKNAAHLTWSRADTSPGESIEPSEDVHRFLQGVATVWLGRLEPEIRVWFGR